MNEIFKCPEWIFSSALKEYLEAYVQYKVKVDGCKADSFLPKLRQFDQHCMVIPEGSACLERETIMGFLSLHPGESLNNQYCRAIILKGFLKYMFFVQDMKDVYLSKMPMKRHSSYIPYIFTYEDILSILDAAEEYSKREPSARAPNLSNSMQCIITMLYCTGMRISEVLDLVECDIDMKNMVININHAKNNNKRIVTISNSLRNAIIKYIAHSKLYWRESRFFFCSGSIRNDGHISIKTAYTYFRRYIEMAGIVHQGRGKGPRMHDLRVTFAVIPYENYQEYQEIFMHTLQCFPHIWGIHLFTAHSNIFG